MNHTNNSWLRKSNSSLCLPAAFALAAYAEPPAIEAINIQVNHNHPYIHYAKRDFRILKYGEGGNCAAIAWTKMAVLAQAGVHSTLQMCMLKTGEGHAFLLLDDGRVLDNRTDWVESFFEVGCQ